MTNIAQHPRNPPPAPEVASALNEATIRRRFRSMQVFFEGLVAEYPRAVVGGRLDAWRDSAHAYIDLITDAPIAPERQEATNGQG